MAMRLTKGHKTRKVVMFIGTSSCLHSKKRHKGFAAVGSEPRLEVLLTLVRAGHDGLTVGEIQERVGLPASTLAHHLRFLAAGGLIQQQKQGRAVVNRAAFEACGSAGRLLAA